MRNNNKQSHLPIHNLLIKLDTIFFLQLVVGLGFIRMLLLLTLSFLIMVPDFWYLTTSSYPFGDLLVLIGSCFFGSVLLIPFIDGIVFFVVLKNRQKWSVISSLLGSIGLQVVSGFFSLLMFFMIVELLWGFGIPFTNKGSPN